MLCCVPLNKWSPKDALCPTKEPGHGHSSPQVGCTFLGSACLYKLSRRKKGFELTQKELRGFNVYFRVPKIFCRVLSRRGRAIGWRVQTCPLSHGYRFDYLTGYLGTSRLMLKPGVNQKPPRKRFRISPRQAEKRLRALPRATRRLPGGWFHTEGTLIRSRHIAPVHLHWHAALAWAERHLMVMTRCDGLADTIGLSMPLHLLCRAGMLFLRTRAWSLGLRR